MGVKSRNININTDCPGALAACTLLTVQTKLTKVSGGLVRRGGSRFKTCDVPSLQLPERGAKDTVSKRCLQAVDAINP